MSLSELRIANLQRGHDVRSRRAEFKRQVKAGTASVAEVLNRPTLPAHFAGMETARFLAIEHGCSFESACELLAELAIPEMKPLGRLTYRQRRRIIEALGGEEASSASPSGRRARPRLRARAHLSRHRFTRRFAKDGADNQ